MHYVTKHDIGTKPQKSVVIDVDTNVLKEYWTTEPEKRSEELLKKVVGILQYAYEKDFWIQCDCHKNALLAIHHSKLNNKYWMRRLTERGNHIGDCVFQWDEKDEKLSSNREGDNRPVRLPDFPSVFEDASEEGAKAAVGGGSGTRKVAFSTPRKDRLQQMLFWLFSKAGLNIRSAKTIRSAKEAKAEILKVISAEKCDDKLALSDFVWLDFRAFSCNWMGKAFRRHIKNGSWPEGKRKIGYLILMVSGVDIESSTLFLLYKEELKIQGHIAVYGRGGEISGPYIAIVKCVISDDFERIEAERAYLHPIVSNNDWMLVDSNLERQAVNAIDGIFQKVKFKNLYPTCKKPLEDFTVVVNDEQQGVRPDFIVQYPGKSLELMIETMGSDDQQYVERKLRTHFLMRTLGDLFEDERFSLSQADADAKLHKAMWVFHYKNYPTS